MEVKAKSSMDELVRAGSLLSSDLDFKSLIAVLVEQAIDITRSDLACLYLHREPEDPQSELRLAFKRGKFEVPARFLADSELIDFIHECNEAVILLERKKSPFAEVLLHPTMQCGIALPVSTGEKVLGVLFLNALDADFYHRKRFSFLDSFCKLAGGMLHNAILMQELKDYLKEIEDLKLYQENIFSSMTNLLVTTDRDRRIHYYNAVAGEEFSLSEEHIGKEFRDVFKTSMDKKILKTIDETQEEEKEILGVEGIYHTEKKDIDFSLNVSPLKGRHGEFQGTTLLFTDQSKERALHEKMSQVVEERRVIKDMFSRYLSSEVVKRLMESPDLIKPGGDKKVATIFFADIRGYTSFSEGKDPEYVISILNEFFSWAVNIVMEHKGYIDKFIGDCIMAAWGVPLWTEKEDAIQAVSCALKIQEQVASEGRVFFTGDAKHLKVGIGMHTGPLVAGNLGSSQKMNYTVIGDTVNIAARLEGVAESGDVIITQNTRDYLDDLFVLEKRKAVQVKGKAKPIPIYNIVKKAK